MTIKDLRPRQGNVELTAEVVEKGEIREFEKFGKPGRVCNTKIRDETGEMSLTLWNDDIEKVDVGDNVKITNGYVNEWQGNIQLTTGKFGKLEILEKSDTKTKPEKSGTEETKEPESSEETPKETDEESTKEEITEEDFTIEEEDVE